MKTLLLLIALSSTVQANQPAPDWLRNAEVYNGWYKQWTDDAIAGMRDLPLVIGVPPDKAVIEKAHKQGTRVLVYVTFYQMPPGQIYQRADVAEHKDWSRITSEGKDGISVFAGSDNPGWLTTCANSPAYLKYVLDYTKFIMDQGADGVFIDNAHPESTCDGPKFGRHKHIYPDKDNMYAYRKLLEAVRAQVKKFGKDKIIIANAGNPYRAWVGACDGQMFESYICTHAADHRWHSEAQIRAYQQEWGPISEAGDVLVTLSYVGFTKNTPREDAYYCYAWSRISGFLYADWFTGKDTARDLYKLRLGKPAGPMKIGDGYYMREFERGLIVVSSESKGATLSVPAQGHSRLFDLFEARHLDPVAGNFDLTLTPGQGRVYLFR